MLRLVLIFLVGALLFAVLGFGGIAAGFAEIAELLFYVFLVLFIGALVVKFVRRV